MNHSKTAIAVAAAGAAALLASTAPALGTPHASHVRSTVISTPLLQVKASKATKTHGAFFRVKGPRTFSAGRVDLQLTALKGEQEFALMRLKHGYTIADLRRDFQTYGRHQDSPTPAAMKALNRIVRRTVFYGGIDSGTGHNSVSGSVVLPRAGAYYLLDDSNGPGAGKVVKLHVTARAGSRTTPTTSATVRATTSKRFRGSANLPASGTIAFHNASTKSPHFLSLQHVKAGTTRKQMIKALQAGPGQDPNVFRQGSAGTDVVWMGKTMTLTYNLPAGDYAEMCFFPDLKTGMPHAFMGMVRIVHLS